MTLPRTDKRDHDVFFVTTDATGDSLGAIFYSCNMACNQARKLAAREGDAFVIGNHRTRGEELVAHYGYL